MSSDDAPLDSKVEGGKLPQASAIKVPPEEVAPCCVSGEVEIEVVAVHPLPWEYSKHPDRKKILPPRMERAILDLFEGRLDVIDFVADTRPVHRTLFSELLTKGIPEYYAGNYRGSQFPMLLDCWVEIGPIEGEAPELVEASLKQLSDFARTYDARLVKAFNHNPGPTRLQMLLTVSEFVARVVSRFLEIHPYVNGNGHIGRILLVALMARYGFRSVTFPVEPGPSQMEPGGGREYNESLAQSQKGEAIPSIVPFQRYILKHFLPQTTKR